MLVQCSALSDTFKLRGTPKARATNRHSKGCWGPVNSHRDRKTARDATMDNPQPSSYSPQGTEKVQRLDGGGYRLRSVVKIKSVPAGNGEWSSIKREPAA